MSNIDYTKCEEVAEAEIKLNEDIVFLLSEILKVLLGSTVYDEKIAPHLKSI